MDSEAGDLKSDLEHKMIHYFKCLMTMAASFEESVAVGSKLLAGFQQGLEFLRRPPVNTKSELIQKILKANESRRVVSYIEAGGINVHDSAQKVSVSLLGLQNHINIARNILKESESHLVDAASVMQNANETFLANEVVDCHDVLPGQSVINNKCEDILLQNSNLNLEHTDYAAMMAVIYNMMKQDFLMQERIVSALNLKLSSGELESYCLMWSLRPFINDDIMHEAWKLIR